MVRAALLTAVAVAFAAASAPLPIKHLAGPPSTFGLHRIPPTNDARIGENSCLVEVDLTPLVQKTATTVETELVADSESQFVFSLLSPAESSLELVLRNPNGDVVPLQNRALRSQFPTSASSTFSEKLNTTVYSFFDDDIIQGIWKLSIGLKSGVTTVSNTAVRIVVFNEAAIGGVSRLATYVAKVGGQVAFQAWLGSGAKPSAHAVSKARRIPLAHDVSWTPSRAVGPASDATVTEAKVAVTLPDGLVHTVVMRDDGLEFDAVAGDNVYTGGVTATLPGLYTSVVQLEGKDASGRLLRRTVQQMMAAVADSVSISGAVSVRHASNSDVVAWNPTKAAVTSGAAAAHLDIVHTSLLLENTDVVEVLIGVNDASAGKYRVYTELYADNGATAVAWFGGMAIPVDVTVNARAAGSAVPVHMDGSWLTGTSGPYVLKNTVIYDVASGTVLSNIPSDIVLPASFGTAAAAAAAAAQRSITAAYAAAGVTNVVIGKTGAAKGSIPASAVTTSPTNSVQARYGLPPASLYAGNFAPSLMNGGTSTVMTSADADVAATWLLERPRTAAAVAAAIRARDERAVQGVHGTALTHGYCADANVFLSTKDVWTHNPIFFEDLMQSRSNDDFAAKIHAFAADKQLDSYSLVGHSQGGVVSTHLVNYYWAGADRATYRALARASARVVSAFPVGHKNGPPTTSLVGTEATARSVQSIGTPYHGCTMAGTLAGFGSIFGVGCGTNFDLSLDGAKLWTSGIADHTRAQVYLATTSYKLNTLFGDYCNMAANSVLQWPNDGVTEITYAVLEGATDLGNTEKECHTSDMAYIPQWTDVTRNTQFNEHAI